MTVIEFEDGHIVLGEAVMGAAVLVFVGGLSAGIWGSLRLIRRVVSSA